MPAGAAASKATLLEAPIWRVTFRYGAPIAVALAFHGLFNLADLVFLGRLGRDGVVAAVNLASILVTAPLLVFDGACNAGVAWIARSKGAGLKEESAAYGGALTFAAIVASALSAIGR
jgi:Na+-driven multidrug efflux pump